jgi:hypothetical protein
MWGPLVAAAGDDSIGSLREAQEKVQEARENGTNINCACCGKPVALRPRGLNKGMAHFLCLLVIRFRSTGNWIDVKTISSRGGDYAKLRFWGLIEQKPNLDSSKGDSGLWRPTQKGIDFVDLKISVPSHVYLMDGVFKNFSKSTLYIDEVKKFDYKEIMGR